MALDYYDRNAAGFFADSVGADMHAAHARFLAHVPEGGSVLDAGCGSGRDARAFKEAGYDASAFDGSTEMVRLASKHAGVPVFHKQFSEVDWVDAFDGVWACASLLHLPRKDLPDAVTRLVRVLRHGGAMFLSFKYGETERWQNQRPFTDMIEPLLSELIEQCGLVTLDMWTSEDVRPQQAGQRWLSAIVKRAS